MVSSIQVACAGLLVAVFLVSKIRKYLAARKLIGNTPYINAAFAPLSMLGAAMPASSFNLGLTWQWDFRNIVYRRLESETIAVVPYLLGEPSVYTSSMELSRQLLSSKLPFEKSEDATQGVRQYGDNIFSSNGDEWRRHRRILGPAFSNETYQMVWEETSGLYHEMTAAEGWEDKQQLDIPSLSTISSKFTLTILARCAFGHPLAWKRGEPIVGKMDFGEALETVMGACIPRLLIPKWMYWLPITWLQKLETAHQTVFAMMHHLIKVQRDQLDNEEFQVLPVRRDLFSLMVRASEAEGEKLSMTDDELVGNTFFLLFAGHETTAHIMDATMAFLGLYPEIQEEMYQQVMAVAPGDIPITLSMYSKLEKLTACFVESGRLYPPGFILMRDTTEDVVLPTYDENGVSGQIAIAKGVRVSVDMVGLHYNPRHFPEPEEYKPSRWYGVPESELSIFSVGPRACTGRKFAITEATCFLAYFLRDWKIDIVLNTGETRPQWRKRMMKAHTAMTMGVGEIPVRLTRRVSN